MEWEPSYQKHCRQPETIKEPSICSCRLSCLSTWEGVPEPSIRSCRLSCLLPWALGGKTVGRLKRCEDREDPEWNSPHQQALDYREELKEPSIRSCRCEDREDPEWNSPHQQALDYREEPWILIQ